MVIDGHDMVILARVGGCMVWMDVGWMDAYRLYVWLDDWLTGWLVHALPAFMPACLRAWLSMYVCVYVLLVHARWYACDHFFLVACSAFIQRENE